MNNANPEIRELTEYKPQYFQRDDIPYHVGESLYQYYGKKDNKVDVEFPSPRTDGKWVITPQGWVGYIPLPEGMTFYIKPKVEIENIFRMLEYAYNLKSFRFLEGQVDCQTMEDLYERLANILAQGVLSRSRKGLYRTYIPKKKLLSYVRGRIEVEKTIRHPWQVKPSCHFKQHTTDIEENQILTWTLSQIARSRVCSALVMPTIRQAYRGIQRYTTLVPFTSQDCQSRSYNRLNEDYMPLHALCRFFLDHCGPSHERGENKTLPFLVNMARLYELFVAEWLKRHLPEDYEIKAQERLEIGSEGNISFNIDLVLYNVAQQRAIKVLDTKYKAPVRPSSADVQQAIAYANMKQCNEAILIYPQELAEPLDEVVGSGIRVRSLTFSLNNDIEQNGSGFLEQSIFQ